MTKKTLYFYFISSEESSALKSSREWPSNWDTIGPDYTIVRRESAPSEGNLYAIIHYKNGEKHSRNGPARTYFYPSGLKKEESFFIHGEPRTGSKPFLINYNEDGSKSETYHPVPYEINYDKNGQIISDDRNDSSIESTTSEEL